MPVENVFSKQCPIHLSEVNRRYVPQSFLSIIRPDPSLDLRFSTRQAYRGARPTGAKDQRADARSPNP